MGAGKESWVLAGVYGGGRREGEEDPVSWQGCIGGDKVLEGVYGGKEKGRRILGPGRGVRVGVWVLAEVYGGEGEEDPGSWQGCIGGPTCAWPAS